jgi:hypothetical protein
MIAITNAKIMLTMIIIFFEVFMKKHVITCFN